MSGILPPAIYAFKLAQQPSLTYPEYQIFEILIAGKRMPNLTEVVSKTEMLYHKLTYELVQEFHPHLKQLLKDVHAGLLYYAITKNIDDINTPFKPMDIIDVPNLIVYLQSHLSGPVKERVLICHETTANSKKTMGAPEDYAKILDDFCRGLFLPQTYDPDQRIKNKSLDDLKGLLNGLLEIMFYKFANIVDDDKDTVYSKVIQTLNKKYAEIEKLIKANISKLRNQQYRYEDAATKEAKEILMVLVQQKKIKLNSIDTFIHSALGTDIRNEQGASLLDTALNSGNVACLRLLLRHGAAFHTEDHQSSRLLCLFSQSFTAAELTGDAYLTYEAQVQIMFQKLYPQLNENQTTENPLQVLTKTLQDSKADYLAMNGRVKEAHTYFKRTLIHLYNECENASKKSVLILEQKIALLLEGIKAIVIGEDFTSIQKQLIAHPVIQKKRYLGYFFKESATVKLLQQKPKLRPVPPSPSEEKTEEKNTQAENLNAVDLAGQLAHQIVMIAHAKKEFLNRLDTCHELFTSAISYLKGKLEKYMLPAERVVLTQKLRELEKAQNVLLQSGAMANKASITDVLNQSRNCLNWSLPKSCQRFLKAWTKLETSMNQKASQEQQPEQLALELRQLILSNTQ